MLLRTEGAALADWLPRLVAWTGKGEAKEGVEEYASCVCLGACITERPPPGTKAQLEGNRPGGSSDCRCVGDLTEFGKEGAGGWHCTALCGRSAVIADQVRYFLVVGPAKEYL